MSKMAGTKVPNKDSGSLLDIASKFEEIKKFFKRVKDKVKGKLEFLSPWLNLIRPNIGILVLFWSFSWGYNIRQFRPAAGNLRYPVSVPYRFGRHRYQRLL